MAALKLPSLPFPLEPAGSPPPGCHVRRGALILSGVGQLLDQRDRNALLH